jgi:hypothetical protein
MSSATATMRWSIGLVVDDLDAEADDAGAVDLREAAVVGRRECVDRAAVEAHERRSVVGLDEDARRRRHADRVEGELRIEYSTPSSSRRSVTRTSLRGIFARSVKFSFRSIVGIDDAHDEIAPRVESFHRDLKLRRRRARARTH